VTLLLDTNVVSEWIKPQPDPNVLEWFANVDEDQTYLSVITFAEIRNGIELMTPGQRRERLTTWLERELSDRFEGRVLAVDRAIAERWGIIAARRSRVRVAIGPLDAFLAATAEEQGHTLVTRNVRHFAALGVPVFNPWTVEP
jgi:toxin FitB